MPLQASGPISLTDIQVEHGGSNPISISEYIRGGPQVIDTNPANDNIPRTTSNISFSNFYNSSSEPPGPPTPVRSPLEIWSYSGGLGNTNYEIMTGIHFRNGTPPLLPGDNYEFNDQRPNPGSGVRGQSNIVYTDLIGQAKVGDTLEIDAHAYTSTTYTEYFEFWHYNLNGKSGWYRWGYTGPVDVPSGGTTRRKSLTINSNTPPGQYAIAVALSWNSLGATSYRSWRSYSLQVWG
tara:strand:+ start:153 stop:860 length:708 start_codon:yes stop_codon:yes gene_type:complete